MFTHSRFLFLTYSDASLKIISVDLVGSKPKIIFFDQHNLPSGVVFDDRIVDFIRFKEEVRRFLAANRDDLKSRKVILALNEQEVFLDRYILDSSLTNLKDGIGKYLEPRLPYPLNDATVRFRKISTDSIQLISTKHQLIRDLVSIFENTEFELKKLEPLPLPYLSLLSEEQEPYIFVLAEDQTLEFGLVINKVIVFTSSSRLLKDIRSSQREIVTTTRNLIAVEYEKNKVANTTLRNIFIVGQDAALLKDFFAEENLKPAVIDLLENFTLENSSDIVDYTKALLTATAENEILSFSVKDEIGVNEKNPGSSFPLKRFLLVGFLVIIILVSIVGGLLSFGVIPFSSNTNEATGKSNEIKKATQSASKATTSSSDQKPVEEQTPPIPTINKSELKIQILNGTTTKGLAGQTKDLLVSKGYSVTNIGNAESSNYDQTIVKFKVSKEATLDDLTSALSERYSVIRGDHLNEGDQFDIIIIIGGK